MRSVSSANGPGGLQPAPGSSVRIQPPGTTGQEAEGCAFWGAGSSGPVLLKFGLDPALVWLAGKRGGAGAGRTSCALKLRSRGSADVAPSRPRTPCAAGLQPLPPARPAPLWAERLGLLKADILSLLTSNNQSVQSGVRGSGELAQSPSIWTSGSKEVTQRLRSQRLS